MTGKQAPASGARTSLLRAWRTRRLAARRRDTAFVVELRGGAGALVKSADARRLVTTVPAVADAPSNGVEGWLERRQARRSAVLVVPDRATGVALALRWRLDPQRFRLADGYDPEDGAHRGRSAEATPWHSRG